jgi:hypothetical protein
MERFVVYIWSIWDNFGWITDVSIISLFVISVTFMWTNIAYYNANSTNEYNRNKNKIRLLKVIRKRVTLFFKMAFLSFILTFTIKSFIPNKNELLLIMSAPYIVEAAKEANTTEVPKKILIILNKSLDYINKKIEEQQ